MQPCRQALTIICFFPYRVYKNFDPRAKIIREVAEEVFEIQGRDPLIDVAVELEKRARSDDYFVSRNLYPNVDFYSGAQIASVVNGRVPFCDPSRAELLLWLVSSMILSFWHM